MAAKCCQIEAYDASRQGKPLAQQGQQPGNDVPRYLSQIIPVEEVVDKSEDGILG